MVTISTFDDTFERETSSLVSGRFQVNIMPRQETGVLLRFCFTSSLSAPSFEVEARRMIITLDRGGCIDLTGVVRINRTSTAQFILDIYGTTDALDEPDEVVTLTVSEDPENPLPDGVTIDTDANTASITIRDDDPTIVMLARTGSGSAVDEGEATEFTVTLGRGLIAGEIIDVPLIVSGTGVTTADWSLARKPGSSLNTGVTLVNETTAAPVVRFTGTGAQTATLLLTAAADNTAEAGGPEMLTLALGPNDDTANGFDLNTRMTNVGGGADPDGTDNTFNITINDDMTAPVPDVSPLMAITEQCSLSETQLNDMAPTATDNQMGTVTVTNNITNLPITSNMTVTWTYTDPTGNTATQTQEVVIDVTAIIPNVSSLNELMAQCEVNSLTAPTAMNCSGESIMAATTTQTPIMGNTTITWTYTDAGNMTTQTQEVTIRDTMSPDPDNDDLRALTAACSIPATDVTIPIAMDNCDGRIMATTDVTPPITASTTITWTYTDAAGNTATQTQEVTIADNVSPTPNPSNNLSEVIRQCLLMENELTVPTATDNCTGSVTVTNNVTTFPITESTMITWTYTDGANNTVTQTQQVTIDDTMAPIPAVANLPMLEDCSQITSLNAPTASDNCDGTITATTNVTPPITTSTTLNWTYTDAGNNTATQTQEVIIGDTEAPMPEVSNLPTLTGECPVATIADLTAPNATDNCDDGTITATTDAAFPITSTTTITWIYTDVTGNTATQTQEVICPLGVADDAAEAIIFPNPSGRYLEVWSSVGGTFQLLSLSGKPLLEGTTNTRIDITSLQSGLYLVQLPDGRLLKFLRE